MAVPFSLPTGKVVYIDDLLSLTDQDIQNMIANDIGTVINDPFAGSSIDIIEKIEINDIIILEIPDIDEIEEIDEEYRPVNRNFDEDDD